VFRPIQRVILQLEVTNSRGGDFNEELRLLISGQSGYIFVTTDQPIYRYIYLPFVIHTVIRLSTRIKKSLLYQTRKRFKRLKVVVVIFTFGKHEVKPK